MDSLVSISTPPPTIGGPIVGGTDTDFLYVSPAGTFAQAAPNDAFNLLAPSQGGNSGKYLTTNGTNTSWGTVTAGDLLSTGATGGQQIGGYTLSNGNTYDLALGGKLIQGGGNFGTNDWPAVSLGGNITPTGSDSYGMLLNTGATGSYAYYGGGVEGITLQVTGGSGMTQGSKPTWNTIKTSTILNVAADAYGMQGMVGLWMGGFYISNNDTAIIDMMAAVYSEFIAALGKGYVYPHTTITNMYAANLGISPYMSHVGNLTAFYPNVQNGAATIGGMVTNMTAFPVDQWGLKTGDFTYVTYSGVSYSGAAATVTGISDTVTIKVGQYVTGTNIPAATYVLSVDSSSQITLSSTPTGAGTDINVYGTAENWYGLYNTTNVGVGTWVKAAHLIYQTVTNVPSIHASKITFGGTADPTETISLPSGGNLLTDTSTGTKFGTATNQKLSFWNAGPIVQPTTAIAASTFAANTSGIADDTATWDGYTIGQVVKALRNIGLLA